MNQALLFWIVACVLFTLLEAFTQLFGANEEAQGIVFVILSLLTLIAFRPMVKRLVKGEAIPTNADSNVGQLALVTKDFDENSLEGRVLVNDMDWAAKSLDGRCYHKGEKVIVERIEGVKCLVRKA